MTKKELTPVLMDFFRQEPGKTFSFKEIFKRLKLNTHPLKMLAIDIMEEMAWDDFLTRVTDSSYRLNRQGQTIDGVFIRKRTGKNSFQPDGTDQKPVFVAERNSMYALDGDRVRVTMMARRDKHIREAVVTEILERRRRSSLEKCRLSTMWHTFLLTGRTSLATSLCPNACSTRHRRTMWSSCVSWNGLPTSVAVS